MYEHAAQANTAAVVGGLGSTALLKNQRDSAPGSVRGGMGHLNEAVGALDRVATELVAQLESGGVLRFPGPEVAQGNNPKPPMPGDCELARAIHERAEAIEMLARGLSSVAGRLQI